MAAGGGEDVPFVFAEEVAGGWGQGEGDDEDVEVLGEEGVQVCFTGAGVPGGWEGAVRVAEVGEMVALIGAGGGCGPWRGGVGEYLAAEGGEDAGYCYWSVGI